MSNERDELARAIGNAIIESIDPDVHYAAYGTSDLFATVDGEFSLIKVADAILAAGYRKPEVVTSAEELKALPVGSIIDAENGGPAQIRNYYGSSQRYIEYVYSDDDRAHSEDHFAEFMGKATVLYRGDR
jgi:hypothetical protein